MPQGKGTYGSQVGRPSKKKYDKGGNVDPFSTRNPKGVPAEQFAEAMENQNRANPEGLPTSDAQDRMQTSPDTTSYKEGGSILRYGKGSTEIKSKPRMPLRGGKKVTDPKKLKQLKEIK